MRNGDLCGIQDHNEDSRDGWTDNFTLRVQFYDNNDPTSPLTLHGEDILLLYYLGSHVYTSTSTQRVEPNVAFFLHQNPTLQTRLMPSHLRDSKMNIF